MKFLIIYSIDIPFICFEEYSYLDLVKETINLDIDSDILQMTDSDFLVDWLTGQGQYGVDLDKLITENIPNYIYNNKELFECIEKELTFENGDTVNRKYTAELTPKQFVDFIEELDYKGTCNTMGMLMLNRGLLPAFNVEISSDCYEDLYVSILDVDYSKYDEIEDKIRSHIDKYNVGEICK